MILYLLQEISRAPLLQTAAALLLACIATRIFTGIRSALSQANHSPSKTPTRISYWLPWVGSALSFVRNMEGAIKRDRDSCGDGVFSYRIGTSKYYIVNMPSLVQQVFAQRQRVLNKQRILEWFMKTAFDDRSTTRDETVAYHAHHSGLNLMLKEDFITEATNKTARAVEVQTAKLVSLIPEWETPQGPAAEPWEKAGNVKVNSDGTVDANLFGLVVNFMGKIVVDMLWGKALICNHPNLQDDLWEFDEGIHHLLTKFLKFSTAGRRAEAARERVTFAMQDWHEAVAAKQAGRNPGKKWGDLDDISKVMQDRVRLWVENKASATLQKANDASVVWGVNANSNKNVFWMLVQIYAQPALLFDIRQEIAPYIRVRDDLKLSIDVNGLTKHCPLIKAAFYETMRMNMSGLSVREVISDVTLKESAADAALFGKVPQSYTIPAGSNLVLANGTMQMDHRIFDEPEIFNPGRFLEQGPDGLRAHMRNLHTFGGGLYKCKGRYFAEKEVLIFAGALLMMWDIEPLGDTLIPPMGYAGASRSPVEDVRVRLTRRFH